MCGIAGVLMTNRDGQVDRSVLDAMRDTMIHRGPDGGESWTSADKRVGLAHRRLSIIDLSTSATQPMSNEDGRVWITFNGEIYNHAGLRSELIRDGHRFRTDHSDTEVLVHGYEQWGFKGLLERIAGDYAFAIWDEEKKALFLARDRIGVKPLYFHSGDACFLFGSEIKSILAHPLVARDVEPISMFHYLSFMTTPAPLTMFRGVYKLPAGFAMRVDMQGRIEAWRYWDAVPGKGIDPGQVAGLSEQAIEDFYISGIRSRLEKAVDRRMMSDVPFGVFLSGGIDSSTNVALMSRLMDRPVDSFTVGFKDHEHLNELDFARQVAREFKTNHHEILIDEKDMVGYLDQLIHHQDEPIADWVCVPLYFVSKLTRDNGVTVIQVGEGSDEQFCGYASYMGYLRLFHRYWTPFRQYLPGPLQTAAASVAKVAARVKPGFGVYADIVDRAARNREHFWSGAMVFWDTMKRELVKAQADWSSSIPSSVRDSGLIPDGFLEADSYNIISSFLSEFDSVHPGRDALTRMIYNEFKLRLPELLLMRVDKITMSESLEARVPFLDHELVEFSMDIPEKWKTRNGEAKYLLKKAVEDLIPHDIIYRKKMGFGAPMADWLRGGFGRQAESAVLKSALLARGLLDTGHIERLFREHRDGRRDNSLYLWTLFNLTSWYDYWIDGQSSSRVT
jgi:asparagine synthase (glutamine-hydrolysing)